MNANMSINSTCPNLWVPTAGPLQGLTVMQQCVYQMTFRNDYEFKKRLVKFGLVWNRTLLIMLSMYVESISMLVFT